MKKIGLLTLSIILLSGCGQTKISNTNNINKTGNVVVKGENISTPPIITGDKKNTVVSGATTKVINNIKVVNDPDTQELLNVINGLLK